ncbi:hypothetical protein C9374_006163 [Naegleria lovaniensis]|uniref:Uncharacterized protein n=1 Tax=Naegleria lovaniensis TaxID=51637 RepID=A0AA88GIV1_NAELO|nr:uncharacterized protein C9374_006163 [Naegleria lovaniensis]KAG2381779.1 hypothetical protein C9374_006163 [Naegleria lovaniensis]
MIVLIQIIPYTRNSLSKLLESFMSMVCKFGDSLHVLIAFNLYLDKLRQQQDTSQDMTLFSNARFKQLAKALKHNLQSKSDRLRLETLKLLTQFEQDEIQKGMTLNKVETTKCVILEYLRDSEECGFDFDQSRSRVVLLEKANEYLKRYHSTIPQLYKTLLSHYIFGAYYTKYSIVWEPTHELAQSVSRTNFNEFWELLISNLLHVYDKYGQYRIEKNQEKSMIYRSKKRTSDQHTINFETYSRNVKKIEKITDIETIFDKVMKDHSKEHTHYDTYLPMIFKDFSMCAKDDQIANQILSKYFMHSMKMN